MRHSLYWDDFSRRQQETLDCLKNNLPVPVRRVAVFITEACNLKCKYCNLAQSPRTLSKHQFEEVIEKYGDTALFHITGGEPSIVSWLYPYIEKNGDKYRFHLNSNAVIPPPKKIKRLKVSLDSYDKDRWNALVGRNVFDTVVENIIEASKETVTSITYTLTRQSYREAPKFIEFSNRTFPDLYALFFSVYKGTNPEFAFTPEDIEIFFEKILPKMKELLPEESLALLCETLNEKRRLIAGVRFPESNLSAPCYLSMSERVISPDGKEFTCSHLYRDGIYCTEAVKHSKCLYGCNQRLVDFNRGIENELCSFA